jgi:hypothetical protein
MIDISKAFDTRSETVFDFFQRREVGYYIPLYQRQYSWDVENIDQLMEDICNGVLALADAQANDRTIHFLGTIILVLESNARRNIDPQDPRALPEPIKNIIDGQQRISTMALLACCLYKKIHDVRERLPDEGEFASLKNTEIPKKYLERLQNVFSLELGRGSPERKPRIIRGSVDQWTLDGDDDNYKSDLSKFLAEFIRNLCDNSRDVELPKLDKNSSAIRNTNRINVWLQKIEKAHEGKSEDFLPAKRILEILDENDIWSYERSELTKLINSTDQESTKHWKLLCSLVQLLGFTHYFLYRCCFTTIVPESEDWAFDMFQSLNATGTPLTSLETFKPQVVSGLGGDRSFKNSASAQYFGYIDDLLQKEKSAASKSKLTNDFLTLFGAAFNGDKKPERQFSRQRRWLSEQYTSNSTYDEKEEFIRRMGDTALYWKNAINFDFGKEKRIYGLDDLGNELSGHASLSIQYLQDANHRMAHTILARFYSKLLRNPGSESANDFAAACKKVAAFFTLWRSALPNTGLDDSYRNLLKSKFSWQHGDRHINVNALSESLVEELQKKGIFDRAEWLSRAKESLRFDDRKTICKFALLISSHETISDPENIGLMKTGKSGSTNNLLDITSWKSDAFKSIEHIAPQSRPLSSAWDSRLYSETDEFHQIGNLILLPTTINSSASNKGWKEKLIYYKYLAEKDLENQTSLAQLAIDNKIVLSQDTLKLLREANYNHHVEPIVQVGLEGVWDKDLVDKRSIRICEILWARMNEWLLS